MSTLFIQHHSLPELSSSETATGLSSIITSVLSSLGLLSNGISEDIYSLYERICRRYE